MLDKFKTHGEARQYCKKYGFKVPGNVSAFELAESFLSAYKAGSKESEKDIITLVLRLMGENPDTFSPEVAEVMSKYASKAMAIIKGGE